MTTVEEKVLFLVGECLDVSSDKVTLEANFNKDLGADSLDMIEISLMIEEEFDLDYIPDEKVNTIIIVNDLVSYVKSVS